MSLLGFDAVGRFAIGQIGENFGIANANLTQAAGIGVAGSLVANPNAILIGATGTGVANPLAQDTVTIPLGQAAGVGVANPIGPSDPYPLTHATGTGIAGTITALVQALPLSAAGVGVAGAIIDQSTAPVLTQAAGIGIAGQIGSSGTLLGVACIGRAGTIGVTISGGGGGRRKQRTGLEPIAKVFTKPVPVVAKGLPVPPFRRSPTIAPDDSEPPALVDPQMMPRGMDRVQADIQHAQDMTDIEDVLAFLDQLED
jgi:hypothetical protein